MINGLVSNCWNAQIAAGQSLLDLVGTASKSNFNYVELRQYSLGDLETAGVPKVERFAQLKDRYPEVEFNLAIQVPFLDPESPFIDTEVFERGLQAVLKLSLKPHLRMVDLSTTEAQSIDIPVDSTALAIANLACQLHSIGGLLSIEHSIQPWSIFRRAFDAARTELSRRNVPIESLKICYDPCNLLIPVGEAASPVEVTRSLKPGEVSMVHFKQRVEGQPADDVCDGEIDWAAVLAAFDPVVLEAPRLLEIPGSEFIADRIASSIDYLQRIRHP